MFRINEIENEFILDLNDYPYDEHSLTVTSEEGDGSHLSWGVEIVSSNFISLEPIGVNTLNVNVDIENLKEESFVILRNYNNERIKLVIKPNILLTSPKEYKFKLTKKKANGRKVNIRILSKGNDNEVGWKCTYDGSPLNYSITPMESDGSSNVEIELLDELFTDISTVIEFTQNKSNEVIELKLNQSNDKIEIIKAD